jgi:N-acetylmuramoyl-L-alanine amidase
MVQKKIYVSPSSQTENKYAVGNTNEAEQCRKIAAALVAALKRCGFDAMTNLGGDMYRRVAESDDYGANLHLPIHTNAYNRKVMGTRIYCYDATGEGYQASRAILSTLAPITPGTSDSINARKGLYEIYKPKAPTAYIEVGFHDNKTEAQWLIENTEAIADCDFAESESSS